MSVLRLVLAAGGLAATWWLLGYVNVLRHQPVVSALVVLSAGGALLLLWWTMQDHLDRVRPARWRGEDRRESVPPVEIDYRLTRLRLDLLEATRRPDPLGPPGHRDRPEALRLLLHDLAAERLRSGHGVDLDADPARAGSLLTPPVHAWLTGAPSGSRTSLRQVQQTVERIEEL